MRESKNRVDIPDLQSQLESLLDEVWRQEQFEREHPFYCATMRGLPLEATERRRRRERA